MGSVCSSHQKNAKVNIDNELYNAVKTNNIKRVKQLLNKGARYNVIIQNGNSALSLALKMDNFDIIDAFVNILKTYDCSFDMHQKELLVSIIRNHSMLIPGILTGKYRVVYDQETGEHSMLCNKIDPNFTVSKFKITPLHMSVSLKNIKISKMLITHGANVDCLDINHDTPLIYAACLQDKKLIKLLLNYGANPSIKNKDGKKAKDFLPKSKTQLVYFLNTVESIPLMILAHRKDPNSSLYMYNLAPDIFNTIIKMLLLYVFVL